MSWPTMKLGEVAEIVSGATPKTGKPEFWDGDIPWVTPKDLSELGQKYLSSTPRKITEKGLKSCAATMLPPQSVLFSSRAPIGLVAINSISVATNQGFKSFVPNNEKLVSGYLYWWLKANREKIANLGRGATFKEVSKAIVQGIEIPLPPLDEQKRIAAILDAADALRAKRRESIEQLDKLAQSVFIDMFGDPVTNPKGWNVRELSKACSKITDGTHHSPPVLEEGIPYVTAKHLKSDGLKFFDDPWFVSPESHAEIFSRCNPEVGDVLYIKDGATTGIAAINQYDFDFSMLSSLALLKPNREVVSSEYLAAYLNNQRNKAHLIGNMGGAAIKRLTLAKIKKFRIPLPPIEMQNRFSQIISIIESQRSKMSSCFVGLDSLFASLQSQAFSGNL
jgi:type I restriction enzyme S subunit